jgi:tyrosinase
MVSFIKSLFVAVACAATAAAAAATTCTGPSLRRAWRDTSCQDRATYLNAVKLLKQLPNVNALNIPNMNTFVNIHNTNRLLIHGTDAFLPWHRFFVYKFEQALQIVSGTCLTLPYWDWERDSVNTASTVLEATTFGSSKGIVNATTNQTCVTEGIANYKGIWNNTVRGGCLRR